MNKYNMKNLILRPIQISSQNSKIPIKVLAHQMVQLILKTRLQQKKLQK